MGTLSCILFEMTFPGGRVKKTERFLGGKNGLNKKTWCTKKEKYGYLLRRGTRELNV